MRSVDAVFRSDLMGTASATETTAATAATATAATATAASTAAATAATTVPTAAVTTPAMAGLLEVRKPDRALGLILLALRARLPSFD
jgi:hypothetical protein